MKKWLDKYEAPKAQNGIEGTMGGLTDKGFNYNGAWGGTMQMGGSLPGAVGFTYARTGSIPSNGPYAKKTKASAQKGKVITKREDFEPWWNWASKKAGDVEHRQDAFGTLGDLYAYYAGQPLHYNTLEYSQYKPTNSKNPNAKYISINDPKFKQEIFDKYQEVFIKGKLNAGGKGKLNEEKINDNTYAVSGYTRATKEEFEEARKQKISPAFIKGKNHVSNAIGRYFISKGKDDKGEYISYYDVFDQASGSDNKGIGETLGLTKPFELYDRIYLDPKTGKPKMQNGGEMKYYQEGLDFKPKTISQDGSIITPYGQWEYPGEITTIPSNEITMEGVPYPVLGISDTGDTQMMYPEEEYEFDGESVTEYPVMQKGGRLPIYVDSQKDPRLKAYQDSLSLYRQSLKNMATEGASPDYKKLGFVSFNDAPIMLSEPNAYEKNDQSYPFYGSSRPSNKNEVFNERIKPVGFDVTYLPRINSKQYSSIYKKPVQPVEYRKPQVDQFGLTKEDYIEAHKSKPVLTPGNKKGDAYYELKKNGEIYKVYTKSGGNNWVDLPEREFNKLYPITNKTPVKPKSKKEEPAKPQPKPQETKKPEPRPQNVYEGSPVYSPGIGSGLPSALIGFANQQGDTTYIKPEDYERFAVPKYGKEFIESKKKQRNGGVNSADAQPIKKLDQLLNFTNYNKPTKGGWLDKY